MAESYPLQIVESTAEIMKALIANKTFVGMPTEVTKNVCASIKEIKQALMHGE